MTTTQMMKSNLIVLASFACFTAHATAFDSSGSTATVPHEITTTLPASKNSLAADVTQPKEGRHDPSPRGLQLAQAEYGSNAHASPSQLREVVVTAEKRLANVQHVPASIIVLSGNVLMKEGAEQLSDYVRQLPGLNLVGSTGPGKGEIVMRGITTGSDTSPLVGVYLNDVPFTPSSNRSFTTGLTLDPDIGDIERIEVLEGPQSTLYGASAMGGLIKFVTKQPDLNALGGNLRVGGIQVSGGGAGYGLRASVNLPIVPDRVATLTSIFSREDPGFVENEYFGIKNANSSKIKGLSSLLRVKISGELETTLSGILENIDSKDPDLVYLNPKTLKPALGKLAYSSWISQPSTIKYRSGSDTTTLLLHFATLQNVISYAHIANDTVSDYGGFIPLIHGPSTVGFSYAALPGSDRYTDELRVVSSPEPVEWIFGLFYTNEKDVAPEFGRGTNSSGVILPPSSPFYNLYTYLNTAYFREKAAYGDLTYHITSKLDVTGGVRYSVNNQSFYVVTNGVLGTNNLSSATTDSAATYLGTISYRPQSNLTIYMRAASAYRPGGGNALNSIEIKAGVPSSFGPDKLWNYETGVKGSFWDRRAMFTADVYHMRWINVQLTESIMGFSAETNGASAKSDGAEASLEMIPVDGLTASIKAAYTSAKITANVPSIGARDGDPLPHSAKLSGAIAIDYRFPAFDRITPRVGASYSYYGAQNTGYVQRVSYRLPAYQDIDLRAGIDWKNCSLSVIADNVGNEFGVTSANQTTAPGFPLGGTVLRPRTISVMFEAKF